MNSKELNDKFNKWNPMENDYKNTEFNKYISGPGADLDVELQPAYQALQRSAGKDAKGIETQAVPSLIFKKLPQHMTIKALSNICSMHGRVREVRDSNKNDYYFVDMVSVADMEAVFRALERNNYGFEVMVSKNQNKMSSNMEGRNQISQNYPAVPPKTTGIDYENRNLRTSQKRHPRPTLKEHSSLNTSDVTNTGLPLNLLTNDVHSLERQGLCKMAINNKFSYKNGRSYISMPERTKQFVENKHKESSGIYNDVEDKFVHKVENISKPDNVQKCSLCFYACDSVCERCSQYYCSLECQKIDWPNHRYICGKPKHMQKTPPSNEQLNACIKNSSNIQSNSNKKAPVAETKAIEVKSMKEISPKKNQNSSKAIPKQLQRNHNSSCQQQQKSSTTFQQLNSNSLKTALQEAEKKSSISLQERKTSSNPSSKKLPAALRTLSKPLPSSENFSQQLPTTSKGSSQKVSQSPVVSHSSSNGNSENSEDIYKQNMPCSGNIVTITAICKTNVVFIRSKTYDDNLSYFNTLDTLQVVGKMLKPLQALPKSGAVVIAKFEEQFYRALVLKAFSTTKISIHYMDYGNMEEAKMEELFEAPKELAYKPRHAIPVLLKDVADSYMTQEIRKFMHTYLNNINVEMRYKPEDFQKDSNVFAVELIDENTQQNLNKMINKLSKPVEPQGTNEICDQDYLERNVLPVGRNVEFIVMDNSLMCTGCISCTTKPYAIEIEKFKKDIQAYVESIPKEAYAPRVHELCIAQYSEDGLWYRGLCLEIVGDGHPSINFIDYGNITMVPIESIRRYPRQFTFPIYTADCAIEGLPAFCDEPLVAKLEKLIPNGELIKCEHVEVDEENEFYILSLPNLIRELNIH